jgi:hypothetical protein
MEAGFGEGEEAVDCEWQEEERDSNDSRWAREVRMENCELRIEKTGDGRHPHGRWLSQF